MVCCEGDLGGEEEQLKPCEEVSDEIEEVASIAFYRGDDGCWEKDRQSQVPGYMSSASLSIIADL